MEKKTPCIKCDQKLWDYIRPHLEKWHYVIEDIGSFNKYPLLIINRYGTIGICTNLCSGSIESNNRELVNDPEVFLARAAELKGYEYKPNNNNNLKAETMAQIDLRNSKIIETTFCFCRIDNKIYQVDKVGELHGNDVFMLEGLDLTIYLEADTCGTIIDIFVNSDDVNRLPNNLLDKSKDFTAISTRNALVLNSGETIPLKETGSLNNRMQVYTMTDDNHLGMRLVVNNDMIPLFAFSYKGMPIQEFKPESINNIFDLV